MKGLLFLLAAVLGNTLIWPLGRWAMPTSVKPQATGVWSALTMAAVALGVLAVRGLPDPSPGLWLASVAFAAAYAVGFWTLVMLCLQIGPAGPTATINNSGMLAGVLYGMLWLNPRRPEGPAIGGVLAVVLGLLLIGVGRRHDGTSARPATPRWWRLILAGGAMACISFMAQTHVGVRYAGFQNLMLFFVAGFGLSALGLAVRLGATGVRFCAPRAIVGGIAMGLLSFAAMGCYMSALRYFGPEVVLPVTIALPMVLTMVLGRVFYRERLSVMTWIGCLLTAAGVAALALVSA